MKKTKAATPDITDKSNTFMGMAIAQYSNLKTIADKQKLLREVHSAYFRTLDMFLNDTMSFMTSDEIFTGVRRPVSHVKEGEVFTGNHKEFAAKAPMSVKAIVEPSGKLTAAYTGGIYQTATSGAKISINAPRKPKKGETILEGYWRNPRHPEGTEQFPIAEESRKAFQGKQECIALLHVAEEKATERHTKGWINCRICGQKNGSSYFTLNGFEWPSGYMHYIKQHNIKPTAEFAGMLITLTKNAAVIEVRAPEVRDESSHVKQPTKHAVYKNKTPIKATKQKVKEIDKDYGHVKAHTRAMQKTARKRVK